MLSSGSPVWTLKSFGMVAGPDGKGESDPVAKTPKKDREWYIMAIGEVGCHFENPALWRCNLHATQFTHL